MDCTRNACEMPGLASTSTFASSTRPSVSATTFSMIGPSVRHGPHHSAHRSTTTGTVFERSMTAVWKVASVTSTMPAIVAVGRVVAGSAGRLGRSERTSTPMGASVAADVEGIDRAGVTGWFEQHVPAASAPLEFDLIAGGHSNLTFRVTDANGRRWVLRRPPLGQVL